MKGEETFGRWRRRPSVGCRRGRETRAERAETRAKRGETCAERAETRAKCGMVAETFGRVSAGSGDPRRARGWWRGREARAERGAWRGREACVERQARAGR